MKRTLIALTTAGILASGGAVAGTTVQVTRDFGSARFVPVQYVEQHDYRWDDRSDHRWDDRSDHRWVDPAANINEREARIRARIQRGWNDGRLTSWEARRLYRELVAIEAKERAYMADGRLNYREQAQLNRELDWLAEHVRAQLRDDERRYSYFNNPYGR